MKLEIPSFFEKLFKRCSNLFGKIFRFFLIYCELIIESSVSSTIFLFSIKITFPSPSNGDAAYNGENKRKMILHPRETIIITSPRWKARTLSARNFRILFIETAAGCAASYRARIEQSNNRRSLVEKKKEKPSMKKEKERKGKERKGRRLCNLSNRILYRRQSAERKRVLRL